MLISRWFRERGHLLEWDSIALIQWDMLVFAPVERLFPDIKKDELLLPSLRPVNEVQDCCYWVMPQYDHYREYEEFLREYDLQERDSWYCPLIVAVFPRTFLDKFSRRKSPEMGFLEYTIPTLAKYWGFDFCTRHSYTQWYTGPIFRKTDPHPYYTMLNSVQEECQDRYVLLHLMDPCGLRIFHPYSRHIHTDRLSRTLPAWLNFLRCNEWDFAELFGESTRTAARHAIAGLDLALPDPVTTRPAICLNMVLENDRHHLRDVLDRVAPLISSWVIVDSGSTDGTQDFVRTSMASAGIPGQLYERARANLPSGRNQGLNLAQDHGDYIWILDAGDTLVGTPDLTRLGADIYWLRHLDTNGNTCWRARLFRDGLRVDYDSAISEYAADDAEAVIGTRVEGQYHIESPRQTVGSGDPQVKLACDRDLLLAEVERNPEDARWVFRIAENCYARGDFVDARSWYARLAEMLAGKVGWEEQAYAAMWRVAESMAQLDESRPAVQDAYLRAWEFRPTRAEPLHEVARRCREEQRWELGYLFAEAAAEIPYPESDRLFVRPDVYAWRALDEQAVCASWIGKQAETFTLCRRLLARPDLPETDRQRIAENRDLGVPTMLEAASSYPDAVVQSLLANPGEPEIVISLIAGPDLASTEHTLNTFVHCCTDISRVGRFLVLDGGLSAKDRALLAQHYHFLEFLDPGNGPNDHLAHLYQHIDARFWLHLGEGWRFFAPENLITRLTAVLQAEPHVFQVAINYTDAAKLTGTSAPETAVRRTAETGRYLLTGAITTGPAMFDTTRLARAGGIPGTHPITKLAQRAATLGLNTGSLDEVLCITTL
ncbi:hypothetical protein MPRG_50160 [Mycobacterium paragordonae]|uniref:Glycosyltransferase n=2 Tax=Mycobacterium paragordonae TaxID=1389713 RepID=A0ABQ1CBT3_9MYCO|nr:hypothetical protein MPRG_50160 [Mycobacterium paragordonae]